MVLNWLEKVWCGSDGGGSGGGGGLKPISALLGRFRCMPARLQSRLQGRNTGLTLLIGKVR